MSRLDRRLRRLEVEGRRAELWTVARRYAAELGTSPAELMAEAERIAAAGMTEDAPSEHTAEGNDPDVARAAVPRIVPARPPDALGEAAPEGQSG